MELRRDLRLEIQLPVQCSADQAVTDGTVLNLSTGGWLVTSTRPVAQGTPLLLRVHLPDEVEPLEVELATVQWSSGGKLGLKNIILGQDEWKRLRRFVLDNIGIHSLTYSKRR